LDRAVTSTSMVAVGVGVTHGVPDAGVPGTGACERPI